MGFGSLYRVFPKSRSTLLTHIEQLRWTVSICTHFLNVYIYICVCVCVCVRVCLVLGYTYFFTDFVYELILKSEISYYI
jgi:hypothetical protein